MSFHRVALLLAASVCAFGQGGKGIQGDLLTNFDGTQKKIVSLAEAIPAEKYTWRPADDGMDRHYIWAVAVDPEDADCWFVSASTGPFRAHGDGNPEAGIYRRRRSEPWQRLRVGLPDPLPSMPYALVTANGRLFAGLADGQVWESRDRGDSWAPLQLEGQNLGALLALASS